MLRLVSHGGATFGSRPDAQALAVIDAAFVVLFGWLVVRKLMGSCVSCTFGTHLDSLHLIDASVL